MERQGTHSQKTLNSLTFLLGHAPRMHHEACNAACLALSLSSNQYKKISDKSGTGTGTSTKARKRIVSHETSEKKRKKNRHL
jgi:hypothetical protein